jgi:hypothetical protein
MKSDRVQIECNIEINKRTEGIGGRDFFSGRRSNVRRINMPSKVLSPAQLLKRFKG